MIATSTPSQWVSLWHHDHCILPYIDSEVKEKNEGVGGSEVDEGMEDYTGSYKKFTRGFIEYV